MVAQLPITKSVENLRRKITLSLSDITRKVTTHEYAKEKHT
jgi:hypothetical protein